MEAYRVYRTKDKVTVAHFFEEEDAKAYAEWYPTECAIEEIWINKELGNLD